MLDPYIGEEPSARRQMRARYEGGWYDGREMEVGDPPATQFWDPPAGVLHTAGEKQRYEPEKRGGTWVMVYAETLPPGSLPHPFD
jgi:hypothetical protein